MYRDAHFIKLINILQIDKSTPQIYTFIIFYNDFEKEKEIEIKFVKISAACLNLQTCNKISFTAWETLYRDASSKVNKLTKHR